VSPARGPRDRSPGWCSRAVTPPRKPRQRAQRYVVGQPQRKLCGHEEARTPEHTGLEAKRTSSQATQDRDELSDWDDSPVPSPTHSPARTARRDRFNQEPVIAAASVFDSIVQMQHKPLLQEQQVSTSAPITESAAAALYRAPPPAREEEVVLRWKKYSPSESFQNAYKAILCVLCVVGCSILVAGPLSQRAAFIDA